MSTTRAVRWGILGTANIARASFLPALRAAEGGIAMAVGSRDGETARQWALRQDVERGVAGYEAVLADDQIDAVYVALPNSLHAEWTIAALRAGKAVLCEKPLCTSVAETESVLATAAETGSLLWEAFVFPFHRQFERLIELLRADTVGDIWQIESNFYFQLRNRRNIRLSPALAGGALNDVGCYCLRLAQLIFEAGPDGGQALPTWAPEGVDEEMRAIVSFPGNRRMQFGCGVTRPYDTFTRLHGTRGEIRLSNPFHPNVQDTIETREQQRTIVEHPVGPEPSFTGAIRHIHAVLTERAEPRRLAREDSLVTARTLAMLHQRMESYHE